jgi:NADPH:quinone reductase-like Zn-dependent oxidoreductase
MRSDLNAAGAVFFYAEATTARLQTLTTLFDTGRIAARVGLILPLSESRQAQRMLAGGPHKSGKIVLQIGVAITPVICRRASNRY